MCLAHEVDKQASRHRRNVHRRRRTASSPATVFSRILLAIATIVILRWAWFPRSSSSPANIAYFIQVSPETVLHLPRLLRVLHHPKNVYLVHFDIKIPASLISRAQTFLQSNSYKKNVFVLPQEAIAYAGISMLLNTINAISEALRYNWDFFINLSGTDYPLLNPDRIRSFLGRADVLGRRLNFLQAQEADKDKEWFVNKRLGRIYIDTTLHSKASQNDGTLIDLNTSSPYNFSDVTFVKSEGWVILHRSFCEYAVNSASGRRLLLSYATARAADELFFGALLSEGDEFRRTMTWDSFRFIKWGLHGTRWSRPGYLDEIDEEIREELRESGAFFARKFRNCESELKDFIDENMSGMAQRAYGVNDSSVAEFAQKAETRLHRATAVQSVTAGHFQV
ncbi:Beta-glucuronosyltransferase GlcAT14A [Gracilariopsis chorda]|uniref:Beta-glucuronosyltransferase GlcAT14A n=1 Tax=Gracilariopsis chorda TaxID=448386 RepID=A0A2V3IUP0_9FLOR|nr:Beta-glucuronosyltransferase GlcAT14A [Gracilariopsis chorda]|eukprot:PXF45831.1 Beta-glucuronosyltransferase GlcAT14A [Gracilariopsis chorda]